MKILVTGLLASAIALSTAHADCGFDTGRISIIGVDFPAIHTVAGGAMACSGENIDVKANLTLEHTKLNAAGMSGYPAEYTSAIVSNSSIMGLMNKSLLRPLDELIAKHGQDIPKNQLITFDGKVMAVAFLANAQHLTYRKDVLQQLGLEPPTSYEDMLVAAEAIRKAGLSQFPLGGAFKAGWHLAQEFINMYLGYGGELYRPGSAEPTVNNAQGVAALNMLKSLSAYMNPDFLSHDHNDTTAEMQAGNVMLMNMWGSRLGRLQDGEGTSPEIANNIEVGGPLMVGDSGKPATTLWWAGWTVAQNISDEDAEATFLAMKNGTSPSILTDKTMRQAAWTIEGFQPSPFNYGVFASVAAGAQPYPMLPYQALMHAALSREIADFLLGQEDAAATLADVEAAYTASAKEKGFL